MLWAWILAIIFIISTIVLLLLGIDAVRKDKGKKEKILGFGFAGLALLVAIMFGFMAIPGTVSNGLPTNNSYNISGTQPPKEKSDYVKPILSIGEASITNIYEGGTVFLSACSIRRCRD